MSEGLNRQFTVEEAALYLADLGICDHAPHPETMRRWLREGKIHGEKVESVGRGGSWRITLAELLAFDPGRSGGRQGRPRKDIDET